MIDWENTQQAGTDRGRRRKVTGDIKTPLVYVVFMSRTDMLRKQHNLVKVVYHTILMAQEKESISATYQGKGKKVPIASSEYF